MDEKVLPLNQVSCDPSWWIEEYQAQQNFFEWISQEIASPMPPRRDMFPTSLLVGHLVDGLSHCLLRKRVFSTPILLLSLAVQHQNGLEMSLLLSP
jgi:hypothetical protein